MSREGGHINPNIPADYQPAVNDTNFSAPAHNLSNAQKEAIVEIAESTGHGEGSGSAFGGNLAQGNIGSGAGSLAHGQQQQQYGSSSGLGHSSNTGSGSGGLASNLRESLSGGDSSRRHDGEYNLGQSGVPHSTGGVGRDAAHLERSRNELGNVAGTHGLGNQGSAVGGASGHGHGTRQAAGLGAGAGAGGLAAAASAQGLGGPSSVDRRSSLDQERRSLDQERGSGYTDGRTGHGSNMQEAMRDASGNQRSAGGAGAAGLGAAGAGAAGASAIGGGHSSGSNQGGSSNSNSLLNQPKNTGGLAGELEERARKAGTHAAGFGVHGSH